MFQWLRPKNPRTVLKKALRDYSLPTFPGTVTQVLERIRDDSSSAASVADALSADPGLSVRVLATVNSAAYAPRRKVDNLGQAVVILGISNLETLVFAIAVNQALPAPECRGFDASRFWLTSARRAAVARALAERLHPASRSVSFTAGLLQDMAVPLLARSRPDEYGPILEPPGGLLCRLSPGGGPGLAAQRPGGGRRRSAPRRRGGHALPHRS